MLNSEKYWMEKFDVLVCSIIKIEWKHTHIKTYIRLSMSYIYVYIDNFYIVCTYIRRRN